MRLFLALCLPLLLAGNAREGCVPRKVVTVLLYGDSTQVGSDATGHIAVSPAALLQASLDQRFGAGAVVVTSHAVAGTTSMDLLYSAGTLRGRADITVLNHGLNDMRQSVPVPLYSLALHTLGATLYETPLPVPDGTDLYAAKVREFGSVADVDAYVRSLPDWQSMLLDGTHPSAELHRLISRDVLAPAVAKLVAELRCAHDVTTPKMAFK